MTCAILDLEQARRERGTSIRAFAAQTEQPRSTLQDQLHAAHDDGMPRAWQPFFESDAGLDFTRRLMVVLLVVVVLRGGCSVERVAECFEAMHLRRYVASSPTTLRRLFAQILTHVGAWGRQQFERLAPQMPRRDVVLAVDENFHWDKILLGLMDVVSGFVFGERMSDTRDGATWEATVRQSLAGYDLCLRAITRDGARAFDTCAAGLGVPAGPDVFHLQHALCATTARPLANRARRAQETVRQHQQDLTEVREARARAEAAPRGPGRPPDWQARETVAARALHEAEQHAAAMQAEREAVSASIRALGDAYHPVDLATGEAVSAQEARERLQEVAEALCAQAARASLGGRVIQALNRLFVQLDGLAAMVAWWHQEVHRQVASLALPAADDAWIERALVPALYIQRRIGLARDAAERAALRTLWARLRVELLSATSPWRTWEAERQRRVLEVVQVCVSLFPRSTSALEGHNGQDALCQHQRHTLSDAFRTARLIVRNYVVTRADGTTAAERLFGRKPGDLIEYLCEHIKLPGRGRLGNRRPKPPLLALTG
jgi:hypothetical protein